MLPCFSQYCLAIAPFPHTPVGCIQCFLGVGLVGGAAAMAIYGLQVNTAQSDAIDSLPNVTAGFDTWLSSYSE